MDMALQSALESPLPCQGCLPLASTQPLTHCRLSPQLPAACPSVPGYTSFFGADHVGNDLTCVTNQDPTAIANICSSDAQCRGFTVAPGGNSTMTACFKSAPAVASDIVSGTFAPTCLYSKTRELRGAGDPCRGWVGRQGRLHSCADLPVQQDT